MEFLQKNARAVVIALLAVGVVVAVSSSNNSSDKKGDDGATDTAIVEGDKLEIESDEAAPKKDETDTTNASGDVMEKVETKVEKNDDKYSVSAGLGDSQTKIMRRVITEYEQENKETLSPEQRLYMETNLVNDLGRNDLIYVGENVSIASDTLKARTEEAKMLTEAQLAAWATYL